jgi:ribosomal protein S18 acetylase RimI-like enzyme
VGDTAVATAEATLAGGAVGLYNIATLAARRRRGFGRALTLAPLLDARAEGYGLGVLQASSDGAGVYRRAGFRETGVYTEYQPRRG